MTEVEEPDLTEEEQAQCEELANRLMSQHDADRVKYHWREGEFAIELIFDKPEDAST